LAPVWDSPYLTVKLYSEVTKINFDENKIAQGVEFIDRVSSKTSVVFAQNEVILSAGAMGTPKLLQLSGIGDPDRLQKLGIPVVANVSGVGTNLNNHVYIQVNFMIKNGHSKKSLPLDSLESLFMDYNLGKSEYFGSVDEKYIYMFVSSKNDILNPDILVEYYPSDTTIAFFVTLQRSYTKGFVRLVSKDPNVSSHIEYFPIDPRDVKPLLWGIHFVRDLVKVSPLSEIIDRETSPGSNLTDQQLQDWIIKSAGEYNHWTGSCALGDSTSPNAVVNTSLLVNNVQHLRIADASVIINSGSGNIQASVMAVGEIASDLILGKKEIYETY